MQKNSKKAWVVLIGVGLAMLVVQGICTNCLGVLYTGMAEDMSAPSSAIMLFSTFKAVTMTLMLPILGKLLAKSKNPKLLFILSAIDAAGAYMLLSVANSLPALYAIGVLAGLGSGLMLYMCVPYFVNSWFADKGPLAMGIAFAISSAGSMIFSPIAASIISADGWRACALRLGLVTLIVAVGALLIFVRVVKDPSERYGAAKAAEAAKATASAAATTAAPLTGVSTKVALKSPTFYLTWLFIFSFYFIGNMLMHIPSCAVSFGYSLLLASTLVSVVSATGIVVQFCLGGVVAKFGWFKTVCLGMVTGLLAAIFWLMGKNGDNSAIMYVASVAYAMCVGMPQVVCPLMVRDVFGDKDFTSIWSKLATAISLSGALGVPALALVYNLSGTYVTSLYVLMGFVVLTFVCLLGAKLTSKKLVKD